MSTRRMINVASLFALVLSSVATTAALQGPSPFVGESQEDTPYLRAFPDGDFVDGEGWPQGLVTLTIFFGEGGEEPFSSEADSSGHVEFNLRDFDFDLKRGHDLTMTDGLSSVTHKVRNLVVEDIDLELQTVSGTLALQDGIEEVHVFVGDGPMSYVYTNGDGDWLASFAATPVLGPQICLNAEAWGGAGPSSTIVDWCSPWLTAFPEWEFVEGYEWPLGSTVHLTIDPATGGADVEMDDTAEPSPWGDPRTYVSYDLPEDFDLMTDDVVTLTDGVTTRTMTVRSLAVTSVDAEANTVAGTADPHAVVNVWPHETGEQVAVTADGSGHWGTGLAGDPDIVLGSAGRAEIRDKFYNGTAVDWSAPTPWLMAFPENDAVEVWGWPNGSTVTLAIDGHSYSAVVSPTPWGDPRTYARFEFAEDHDLEAGDFVAATDGATGRTHEVKALREVVANAEEDTVSGIAPAGATVQVWPHETGELLEDKADSEGFWQVDYTGVRNLEPGMGGRSQILDPMGNATAVDWNVPNPWFSVFPLQDVIEAWDWPLGPLTVTIADFSAEGTVIPSPWGGPGTWAWIDLYGHYDIEPHDVVTVTDGSTTRTYEVQDFAVTSAVADTDIVAGTAEPGAPVNVWPNVGGAYVSTVADSAGQWSADFSGKFDLVPGTEGQAETREGGGNATAVGWRVPNPLFTVFPEWEWFDGLDWPNGATVTITVETKPECGTTAESSDWFFNGSFGEGCDITVGDVVTFTDGEIVKSHEVRDLSITSVNVIADTVSGTAEEGAEVHVWPHETGQEVLVTAASDGHWMADFGGQYDIGSLSEGRSEVRDEDDDATAVDWAAGFAPPTGELKWIVAYTYDLPPGTLTEGSYDYHFELEWTTPEPGSFSGQGGWLDVSDDPPIYNGYALLRGPMELRRLVGRGGLACEEIDAIHPDQPARFLIGWLTDVPMTHPEARAFFDSLTGKVVWGADGEGPLVPHEMRPWRGDLDAWFQYVCTFTQR